MADFLEGIMLDVNMSSSPFYKEQHKGLLIVKYLHGAQYATDVNENPLAVPLMSLIFNVDDDKSLWEAFESGAKKDMAWQREINQEAAALAQESNLHDDILVVDLMDVYRNLPHKLLLCHEWFYEHYKAHFLLKTDDDCFISLPSILTHLSKMNSHEDPLWWGNFRRNWLVERHGKWKEERYTAPVYPAFACGSGSIVSRPVHSLLVNNSRSFNLYQGEDVSMGIWLSAFEVRREHDTRWRCTKSCTDDMIALPQLNAESIAWHWNNSKHCPSLCESC